MEPYISLLENKTTVISPLVHEPCRLTLIGDYHCALSDWRDDEHQANIARMAQYGRHEMDTLRSLVGQARENSDAILLAGDIVSFPTLQNIETLASIIRESETPCLYVAGNHDWHFEGMAGSDREQREAWISRRLRSLYNGHEPLCYSETIRGMKILMVDNSIYHILPEQLAFVEKELSEDVPVLLCMHIPIYLPLPGREKAVVDYGCGHPLWGAAADPYWKIEQRERWAEKQTPETAVFCRLLSEAPNIVGIVAGHTHVYCVDCFNRRFQLVLKGGIPHRLELLPGGCASGPVSAKS